MASPAWGFPGHLKREDSRSGTAAAKGRFFLFIVGVAIPLSLDRRRERGEGSPAILGAILRRSALLFLLGIVTNVLYSTPVFQLASLRIMGVLQRIALVYCAAAVLHLTSSTRRLVAIGTGILLGYWAIMTLIPVPGHGLPDLGIRPDGVANNLEAWLDQKILGSHVYAWTKPWDPEGCLSTLPAIVGLSRFNRWSCRIGWGDLPRWSTDPPAGPAPRAPRSSAGAASGLWAQPAD